MTYVCIYLVYLGVDLLVFLLYDPLKTRRKKKKRKSVTGHQLAEALYGPHPLVKAAAQDGALRLCRKAWPGDRPGSNPGPATCKLCDVRRVFNLSEP